MTSINPIPGRSLQLHAYDGSGIPNSIEADPSPNAIALAREGNRMLLAAVPPIAPPTGRYNCHGLVFASRRTGIPPANQPDAINLDDLLTRDRFTRVATAQVGDVIVYRYRGVIHHTGIVNRVEEVGRELVVFIWSAWGSLGEFEHRTDLSPYHYCSIEYWRLA